jgi:peptide/nickel transport system substrate-binding protein
MNNERIRVAMARKMKKVRSRLSLILALFMLLALAAGCDKTGSDSPTPSTPPTTTGTSPDATPDTPSGPPVIDQIVIGTTQIGHFNPAMIGHDTASNDLIFDRLFRMDPATGEFYSDIFESMEWSEDGLILTCKMYENIYFSNGQNATAEDALYSFLCLAEPWAVPVMLSNSQLDVDWTRENGYVDKYTVQFKVKKQHFLFQNTDVVLVCKEWAESVGYDSEDWYYNTVVSGRYEVVEYVPGSHYVARARPDYWNIEKEGPHVVQEYYIKVYPDTSVAFMDLELGNVDFMIVSTNDYARWEKNPIEGVDMLVKSNGSVMNFVFGFNNNEVWFDKRVREAIAIGIDWNAMGETLYREMFEPSDSLVPKSSPYYISPDAPREFNPEKAKQLLAEAGYGPGELKLYARTFQDYKDMMEIFQGLAGNIGIEVTIEFGDTTSVIPYWGQGGATDFGFYAFSMGTAAQDVWTNSTFLMVPGGIPWYTLPFPEAMDIWKDVSSIDPAARMKASQEFQKYVYENIYTVSFAAQRGALGFNSNKIPRDILDRHTSTAIGGFLFGRMGMLSAGW